jgi:multidrug resistance protein, MATE family
MEQLTVTSSYKAIIKLALPISLAILIPQISISTNNMFVGRLGQLELGVNGITGVFYLILSMVGYGLNCGIQIQMARRAGEQDREGLTKTLMSGMFLAIAFATALMLLTTWLVPTVLQFSLSDRENYQLSIQFIALRIWGLPCLLLAQLFSSFFIAIGRTKLLIYGSLATTLLNIAFDYLLIFGHGGFAPWGLQGAAAASVIAETGYALTFIAVFFARGLYKEYPFLQYVRLDIQFALQSLKTAAPLILQFLFSIGGWLVFFVYVEHLGRESLAASQMLRAIFGITSIGTWALATTCNTMVSNLIGQGKTDAVLPTVFKVGTLSLIYSGILGALLLAFSTQFLSLYSDDAALIAFAIPSLRVIAAAIVVMGISTTAFNGVVGTGNTVVNFIIETSCVGLYLVYCWYFIEVLRSPLYICWGSEFVYWVCLVVASTAYLRSGRWKGKVI